MKELNTEEILHHFFFIEFIIIGIPKLICMLSAPTCVNFPLIDMYICELQRNPLSPGFILKLILGV